MRWTVGIQVAVLAALAAVGRGGETVPPEGFEPLIVDPTAPARASAETPPTPAERPSTPPSEAPKAPAPEVDKVARTVRIPVELTGAEGVIEWILGTARAPKASTILVTPCRAQAVADALAAIGLAKGTPPEARGDGPPGPPSGPSLELSLVWHTKEKPGLLPATRLFAPSPDGRDAGPGRWVYAGPATVREGEATLLVASVSGSLVTTNLRDTSALIYWVPGPGEPGLEALRTWYAAKAPGVPAGSKPALVVRPAAPPKPPKPVEPGPEGAPPAGAPDSGYGQASQSTIRP